MVDTSVAARAVRTAVQLNASCSCDSSKCKLVLWLTLLQCHVLVNTCDKYGNIRTMAGGCLAPEITEVCKNRTVDAPLNERLFLGRQTFVSARTVRTITASCRRLDLTTEDRVQYQTTPCVSCCGQSGTRTSFAASTGVFRCQYHFTHATRPYVIHLSATTYRLHFELCPTSSYHPTI